MPDYKRLPIENDAEQKRLKKLFPDALSSESAIGELIKISLWLDFSLSQRRTSRFDGPLKPALRIQTLKELEALGKDIESVSSKIHNLSVVSKEILEARLERTEARRKSYAQQKLNSVSTLLDQIKTSIQEAKTFFVGHRGQPKDSSAKEAVGELVELWTEQTGQKPTLTTSSESGEKSGLFFDFCMEIIAPVYKMYELKCPSVGNLIQKEIYSKDQ